MSFAAAASGGYNQLDAWQHAMPLIGIHTPWVIMQCTKFYEDSGKAKDVEVVLGGGEVSDCRCSRSCRRPACDLRQLAAESKLHVLQILDSTEETEERLARYIE